MTFTHPTRKVRLSLLTASMLYPISVFAADAPAADAKPAPASPVAEAAANDHGINLKILYTGEEWANVSGGNKKGTTNINNVDAQVAVDADKALGWKGGSFLLDTLYNNGRSANTLTGAKQTQSPIDASGPKIFRVLQVWYNQDFDDNRTSLLGGLYLANSEFNLLDSETLFFNGGYSWNTALNQSGHNSPSVFPNASLGTRLREKLDDAGVWTLQAAVLDGTPNNPKHIKDNTIIINHKNGALLLGEADYHPNDKTKVMLGYWRYTAKFDEQFATDASGNPKQNSSNQGLYAGINQHLYSFDDKRGVDGFMNLGVANGSVNRFDKTASARAPQPAHCQRRIALRDSAGRSACMNAARPSTRNSVSPMSRVATCANRKNRRLLARMQPQANAPKGPLRRQAHKTLRAMVARPHSAGHRRVANSPSPITR